MEAGRLVNVLDIGLDVDNVLYPFSTAIARYAEIAKGLRPGDLDDHALTWTWHKDQWGIDSAEFMRIYAQGVNAGYIFTEGDPAQGSVSAARRLKDAGHRLHYVSAREIPGVSHNLAHLRTYDWLTRSGFPIDSLTISDDKAAVYTDVFLDDKPENVSALLAAGHRYPLLWDRPHNRRSWMQHRRVYDWHQFERLVAVLVDDRVGA